MKVKKYAKGILLAVMAFILAVVMGLPIFSATASAAFGDTTGNSVSGVLDDLKKDEAFDTANYPAVSNDYSVQVIQIAETTDKELLVYVYQPAHASIDLTATSINISTAINESLKYKNYKLTLLDTNGVFDKYLVEDFTVKDDALRYYDISAVYRAFDNTIDDEEDLSSTINTTTEISYEVAKRYTACTVKGEVSYTCVETEVVTITSKVVGYIMYDEGFKLYVDKCESHFVAFSCNYEIDKLMEADVYYVTQGYTVVYGVIGGDNEPTYKEPVENYAYLTADQVANNDGDGLFAKDYTWNRIESVSNFIANEGEDVNLTDANLSDLQEKQWILRFCETDYSSSMSPSGITTVSGTRVSDVTILRLKFELDGTVFNLGVVDNKTTGSDKPFTSADTPFDDFIEYVQAHSKKWWEILLMIIFGLILVVACMPVIPYIVKGVIWVLSLPFKLFGAVFKKIKQAVNKNKKE